MTFSEWLKLNHPTMKRRQPVAQTHSGSNRSILTCLCGAERTYASKWRVPKGVEQWRAQHNAACWPAGVERET